MFTPLNTKFASSPSNLVVRVGVDEESGFAFEG